MSRFTIPRDLYYGDNAMEELKNLKGHKKAIIVTGGSSMKRGGFLDKCEKILKDTGLEVKIFDGVEPDPSIETVYKGAEDMREFQPDVIVALGGGSALDAAKAMWVFYEYPEKKFDDIKTPFTMPKLRQKAIFAAIPSTSGTASEVTAFSVITDYSTNIKYPLADFEITPDIAILDYSIPMTMPETVSADTGMDALTHSIEAYVAGLRTDITDALAMKAIDMIVHNIEKAVKGDKEGRAKLHVAQCLAGMAFSNALLGIVHSLAHKTGAEFHITHGRCNAILLPFVIQYNSKVCADRFADIARMLKLSGNTDAELTAALVNKVKELNTKLGIKQTYKDNGVTEDHFKQKCDDIAKNAVADPCTGSNPRETDVANMKKVLEAAYYGNDVNF
ncbi:iron-containing alcohol dehydrogenase [uncultured Brachyspira sp.]|uniref:iron-containing alcohol dehydrogenase n=1 Tax=uncultured Brachyspira sp. TaxID=221953 RepID=UPI002624C7D7|nr:iron-containing alcohol dehydrogenase [uncultured Brachyspira sp.]